MLSADRANNHLGEWSTPKSPVAAHSSPLREMGGGTVPKKRQSAADRDSSATSRRSGSTFRSSRGSSAARSKKKASRSGLPPMPNSVVRRNTGGRASTTKTAGRKGPKGKGGKRAASIKSRPTSGRRSTSRASSRRSLSRASSIRSVNSKKKKSTTGKSKGGGRGGSAGKGKKGSVRGRASSTKGKKKSITRPGSVSSRGRASMSRRSTSVTPGAKIDRGKLSASGRKGAKARLLLLAAMESVEEQEGVMRRSVEVDEELERETYRPIYNVLLMEMVRSRVEEVNTRQRLLNATFDALHAQGVNLNKDESIESLIERLRIRLQSEAVSEVQQLKAENASLHERLEEKKLEVDKKTSEMEVMRGGFARKLARFEMENENMKAEVQATLRSSELDVDRMKKELGHRIDIACASIRTPQYATSMGAMQEHVKEAQREVQQHRDILSKLILSIGARDTFLQDESETMHTNLPSKYRTELQKMEKDQLLIMLDVLSFQEGVVETVGKGLYVMSQTQHQTNVV